MSEVALSILFVLDSQDSFADADVLEIFAGSRLEIVRDLAHARDFLSQQTPDIALVQYQLPDGLGPELLDASAASYPLILLVDVEHQEQAEQAVLEGCFDYLLANTTTLENLPKFLALQRQLWSQMKKFRRAELLAGLGFWEWDELKNRLAHSSEGYARILEMTPDEVMANLATEEQDRYLFHPDDVLHYVQASNEATSRGQGVDLEYRIITPSGQVRHIHEVSEVETDAEGRVTWHIGIVQDITDQKLAQEKLSKSLADARRAERLANLGTYEWDWVKGRLVTCSEEFARIYEKSVDEALQTSTNLEVSYQNVHPEDRERYKAIEVGALAKGHGFTAEYRLLLASGRIRYIREVCEVEINDQGEVIRTMGSMQDVTDQQHLTEQLHQAQKLEAIGQLSGGIAHDFNNLLTVITGNLDLAQSMLADGHPSIETIGAAMKAAHGGAALTGRLLAFSRRQTLRVQIIDVQELLLGMRELLQRTLGEMVRVAIQETDNQWLCETDSAQLESAVLNLAINARDAMPDGGTLRIDLSRIEIDEADTSNDELLNPGDYVCVSVGDTGVGMPPEVLAKVFDPFYTTKGIGKGTGLGLSMVHGFLKQSGGHVSVQSEPGEGTVVRLYLPHKSDGVIQSRERQGIEESRGNGELILVVEDDELVCELAVRLLHDLGYHTLIADNADNALLLLKQTASIELLFSDVVLPGGMNGMELAGEAVSRYPNLKVLLTSGYTRDKFKQKKPSYSLLDKPYNRSQLARTLRKIIVGQS